MEFKLRKGDFLNNLQSYKVRDNKGLQAFVKKKRYLYRLNQPILENYVEENLCWKPSILC